MNKHLLEYMCIFSVKCVAGIILDIGCLFEKVERFLQ